MPRRTKLSLKQISKPAARLSKVGDSAAGADFTPRKLDFLGVFSYPFLVIACYRRYPSYRRSILLSHFVLGLLLFSVLSKWEILPRACCSVFRAICHLAAVLPHYKVTASVIWNKRC